MTYRLVALCAAYLFVATLALADPPTAEQRQQIAEANKLKAQVSSHISGRRYEEAGKAMQELEAIIQKLKAGGVSDKDPVLVPLARFITNQKKILDRNKPKDPAKKEESEESSEVVPGQRAPREKNDPSDKSPSKQEKIFYTVEPTGSGVTVVFHNTPIGERKVDFTAPPGTTWSGKGVREGDASYQVMVRFLNGKVSSVYWDEEEVQNVAKTRRPATSPPVSKAKRKDDKTKAVQTQPKASPTGEPAPTTRANAHFGQFGVAR